MLVLWLECCYKSKCVERTMVMTPSLVVVWLSEKARCIPSCSLLYTASGFKRIIDCKGVFEQIKIRETEGGGK